MAVAFAAGTEVCVDLGFQAPANGAHNGKGMVDVPGQNCMACCNEILQLLSCDGFVRHGLFHLLGNLSRSGVIQLCCHGVLL